MTTTQQAGRAPVPPMMHTGREYACEADQRAAAIDRKRRLMGGGPAPTVTREPEPNWSYAPAPLPVVPDWVDLSMPFQGSGRHHRDYLHVAQFTEPPAEEFQTFMLPTICNRIMREVCEKHEILRVELMSDRRAPKIVRARHEAMWRISQETHLSMPAIGRVLGGRDHTTVIYGIRMHSQRMKVEAEAA